MLRLWLTSKYTEAGRCSKRIGVVRVRKYVEAVCVCKYVEAVCMYKYVCNVQDRIYMVPLNLNLLKSTDSFLRLSFSVHMIQQ